ncbi:MFS transporter [Salinisphaera sp. P385]|uniref:MFS transporter n=1 Tax=Spectribacter acetivorans TaxID=3075603 RepID=A0ABU3B595_9GAMM|nr:MFS transporter [Salinisphaera sp. P385]MDT0617620.1 MFS transporter [Salinisphaera sp. P385]
MNALEWRATGGLAAIYAARMLGLFMILPVFALYAQDLPTATPFQVGLALGIYGLTQALLQIPFGMASDRVGRKPMIVFGLLVFAAGSALAAVADNIHWIIAGRALQGAGAIAAVTNALLADLTRERQRTTAMLVLGIGIGASFTLALMLGPVLDRWIGVPGIFGLTVVLALACIPLVIWVVPPAPAKRAAHAGILRDIRRVVADGQLLRLDAGIFILHAILTALFVVVPVTLADDLGVAKGHHWMIYLPVMLGSLALTMPLMRLAEGRGHTRAVFLGAVALLAMAAAALIWGQGSVAGMVAALLAFFGAFNLLEATLPSLVSRVCDTSVRGAGLGVYSASQFFGAFVGGAAGGLTFQHLGATGVFGGSALLAVIWLIVAWGLRPPVAQQLPAGAD